MKSKREEVLTLVGQYNKKLDNLANQEKSIFEEIKKLNTQVVQLEDRKLELYDGELIDVEALSKISLKVQKINTQIKDKKEAIEAIREARESLERKFKVEIEPLYQELRNEYTKLLIEQGRIVQGIIDSATLQQIKLYDLAAEFSLIVGDINSLAKGELSYQLPLFDIMQESTMNVYKRVPQQDVNSILENGIEYYNKIHNRYGRFLER